MHRFQSQQARQPVEQSRQTLRSVLAYYPMSQLREVQRVRQMSMTKGRHKVSNYRIQLQFNCLYYHRSNICIIGRPLKCLNTVLPNRQRCFLTVALLSPPNIPLLYSGPAYYKIIWKQITLLMQLSRHINNLRMEVRTLPVIMTNLQLLLSLTCLLYNLTNSRTITFFYHFTALPSSTYFTTKYQSAQYQIFAVQFAWHLLTIFTYVLTGIVFVYVWRRSREGEEISRECRWREWTYVVLVCGMLGQIVVTGYCLSAVIEIGYQNGTKGGDYVVAVMQCVTLASLLFTLSIHLYNIQTLHHTHSTQKTPSKHQQDEIKSDHQQGFHQLLVGFVEQNEKRNGIMAEMKLFKPNFNENTSPMGQHFQNLSQRVTPRKQGTARQPLLQPQNQLPKEKIIQESFQIAKSIKIQTQIPKLDLEKMKKPPESNQEPFFILSNLEISDIQPRNFKPATKPVQQQVDDSGSDISQEFQIPRVRKEKPEASFGS